MLWLILVAAHANNFPNKYSVITGLELIYYLALERYSSALDGWNLNSLRID
jgi:hypothetical protein